MSQSQFYPAGFWRRFFAFVVDTILVTLLTIIVGALVWVFAWAINGILWNDITAAFYTNLTVSVSMTFGAVWINWLYYALQESSRRGATPGKMLFDIYVADRHGKRLSFERATARHFAKLISGATLSVGYLMAAFASRKQALHDIIAGSLVIHESQPRREEEHYRFD